MLPSFDTISSRLTASIPLSELEKRLKPLKPFTLNGEWSDTSSGGFLAPDESLLDVVRADYDSLLDLGTDYDQMAEMAANIFHQNAREQIRGNKLKRAVLGYIARKKNPLVRFDRERFRLMPVGSFGSQSCPWGCDRDEYGYNVNGCAQIYVMEKDKPLDLIDSYNRGLMRGLDDAYRGEFMRSLGIEFGGIDRVLYLSSFTVVTDLTPHLIASHHFFEGEASYRTDPVKLWEFVNSGKK